MTLSAVNYFEIVVLAQSLSPQRKEKKAAELSDCQPVKCLHPASRVWFPGSLYG